MNSTPTSALRKDSKSWHLKNDEDHGIDIDDMYDLINNSRFPVLLSVKGIFGCAGVAFSILDAVVGFFV